MGFAERFGENLRRIREAAGLSQGRSGCAVRFTAPRSGSWSAGNACRGSTP